MGNPGKMESEQQIARWRIIDRIDSILFNTIIILVAPMVKYKLNQINIVQHYN